MALCLLPSQLLITFKLFEAEFMQGVHFDSLERLSLELSDYVNWFNNIRIS